MLFKKMINFLIILVVALFPSCIKYYKLSKTEFNQGTDLSDRREVAKHNLRKVAVNDQFSTLAIFDLLWLSDETRTAYVDMNCIRKGKDEQAKMALLARQLEENKHWVTFYVLADIRDKSDGSLTERNSPWAIYLATKDNKKVMPLSIKELEIEPEYKFLFGPQFDLFSRAYEVKFPSTDLTGALYVKQTESFKIVVCSPRKQAEVWWNAPDEAEEKVIGKGKKRKILKNEDFYWIGSQGV